jgi:AmmeMemoRadiSam system protein A
MSSLADCEKKLLLEVARRAFVDAVERRDSSANLPANETLRQPGGAFVTLRRGSRLRGCIGQLPACEPLIEVVARCAKAAALEDPRFSPMRPEEAAGTEIEISVLSPLEDVAPDNIEIGKHGLMVSQGWQRGVLLPQVATQFSWTAEKFLEETCVKAGFDRAAWKDPEMRIQAFTAEVFSESELSDSRGKARHSTST